jgi:hypothetical protein
MGRWAADLGEVVAPFACSTYHSLRFRYDVPKMGKRSWAADLGEEVGWVRLACSAAANG